MGCLRFLLQSKVTKNLNFMVTICLALGTLLYILFFDSYCQFALPDSKITHIVDDFW